MKIFNGPASPFERKVPRIPYRMEKKADTSADVYLYDIIGDSWDGTTAKGFATDLKALGDVKTLNIFINSPGGSVFDGVAIYNQLVRHRAHKVVQIDGIAASIASIVAMAGDEIVIAKNGMVMIHDPWGFAMGTAQEFRKAAESLDKIRESMVATYADRTNSKEDKISAMMTAETWLTADEAVKLGFADSIADNDVELAALTKYDLSQFKNIPKSLADVLANPKPEGANMSTETKPESVEAPAPHPGLMRATAAMARLKLNQGPALSN